MRELKIRRVLALALALAAAACSEGGEDAGQLGHATQASTNVPTETLSLDFTLPQGVPVRRSWSTAMRR